MNVRYDVDLGEMSKVEDIRILGNFLKSENKNMVIEYESKYIARKRRACMRTWLTQKFVEGIRLSVRDNKIFIIKEI